MKCTPDIIKHFNRRIDRAETGLRIELSSILSVHKDTKEFILTNSNILIKYSNVNDIGIDKLTTSNYKEVIWNEDIFELKDRLIVIKLKVLLPNCLTIEEKILNIKAELKKIKRLKLNYMRIIDIIRDFNSAIVDEMITTGYTFTMPYGLGKIRVLRNKVSRPSVDWDATKKYKQELIDKGIPLYSESNPTGKKYVLYYEGDYQNWFSWVKKNCVIPNKAFFGFRPTQGDTGTARRLLVYIKNNPIVVHRYTLRGDTKF